jgi:hemerythrin
MSQPTHPHASVGVPDLDAYHRELVVRVEAMFLAARMSDLERLARAFAELKGLLGHQFAQEEERMRQTGYPQLQNHRAAHDRFLLDLAQLQADLMRKGLAPAVANRLNWMKSWVDLHISSTDARLAAHLLAAAGRGAKPRKARPAADRLPVEPLCRPAITRLDLRPAPAPGRARNWARQCPDRAGSFSSAPATPASGRRNDW